MRVLAVNAGSSTLKLSLLEGDALVAAVETGPGDEGAIERLGDEHGPVAATAHRVVHGGTRFRAPVVVDDAVLGALDALTPLAPLHQPAALAGIRATRSALPDVPAVACFDTAFHATIPEEATTYALPEAWRSRWPLHRFGFHGLSHAYASRRAADLVGPAAGRRMVTCHLGAGSSLAAVVDGTCVDTTMGFTPNEGPPMATRSGSVDPGIIVWLLRHGITVDELDEGLQRHSGLLGLAGTGDMRAVVQAAGEDQGHGQASLALDVWAHRVVSGIASMAASAGGLDVLVFTGGIGERSPELRARVGARLAWLGVALDAAANAAASPPGAGDAEVTGDGAAVRTVVVRAREDLELARLARELLGGAA
jgi:acetate kinase